MDASRALASDARSLDRLKRDAARDPQGALRQAAGQFEALFMQQLLKSMRDAMPKSDLVGGSAHEMYTGMLDGQLAQKLAGRPGGLGEVIARQLSKNIRGGEKKDKKAAAPKASKPARGAQKKSTTPRKAGGS